MRISRRDLNKVASMLGVWRRLSNDGEGIEGVAEGMGGWGGVERGRG